MKNLIKSGLPVIVFAVILSGCYTNYPAAEPVVTTSISYQTFYDGLSPYGTWIDYPGYGNVWNPKLDGEFRPYATNGYWVYSNEGWAWQSNYAWGWAAFHYGRWLYDDNYGWLWVPGYNWSPAWVTWGTVDNYYAWAPLMPEVNVSAEFGSWRPHSFYWNVCGRDHIYDRNISTVIERPETVVNVVNRITIVNNFATTRSNNIHYSRGPEITEVQKFTKEKINPVSFKEVKKSEQGSHNGDIVNVYRPPVKTVQNEQPHEFRKAEKEQVKPIRNNGDMPSHKRNEQRDNVEHLPVHKMPTDPGKNNPGNHDEHNGNSGNDNRGGNGNDRKH